MLFCVFTALADSLVGQWSGLLEISQAAQLKLRFNIKALPADGQYEATMDSPDQGAYNIPAVIRYISADSVSLEVPAIMMKYSGALRDGVLVGRFSQGMVRRDLNLKRVEAVRKRPQTPVPPFPYTTEDIVFENAADGVELAGTLVRPQGCTQSTPVVLFVSGSGLQNRDEELFDHKPFAVIADFLARNGIASLRYDDRGFAESTGDATDATTADFARDAAAGLDYLRGKAGFSKVGVLGHSEGAQIAFILAAGRPAAPDFIVALGAPALRGDSILADQSAIALSKAGVQPDAIDAYKTVLIRMYEAYSCCGVDSARRLVAAECDAWPVSPVKASLKANLDKILDHMNPWLAYSVALSPARYISAVTCPVFAAYGEKDMQVRPQINVPALKAASSIPVVKVYPGLNHLFQTAPTGDVSEYVAIEQTIAPEVLQDIVDFINNRTK